jgi:hypothetical protein
MSTIQIWNEFGPIEVRSGITKNAFTIAVREDATPLPEELEKKVDENWTEVSQKNPEAKNNPILYLAKQPAEDNGIVMVETNTRGFKYTQAYNRNKQYQDKTEELNRYKLLSLSTHCALKTRDNKLLFGTKKNQFNQMSQFSGFPNVEEDCAKRDGILVLDVPKTIENRLKPEIGDLTRAIGSITALGITYVNTPGLRGTDMDYLAELDATSESAQIAFQESAQFQKQLFSAQFEPEAIRKFVQEQTAQGKTISRYALGCLYLITDIYFGPREAQKFKETIQKELKESISTTNETNYFA